MKSSAIRNSIITVIFLIIGVKVIQNVYMAQISGMETKIYDQLITSLNSIISLVFLGLFPLLILLIIIYIPVKYKESKKDKEEQSLKGL